jgi:hypothetical protein
MDNIKLLRKIAMNLMLLLLVSCVKTDDFDIPELQILDIDITPNTTIQSIKNAFEQSQKELFTFDSEDGSILEGFVISSDEAGNFYKVLVIQDKNENATAGVEILIDTKSYFTKYNFGRKIHVKMAGLSMKNDQGKYKIGFNLKNDVVAIPESLLDDFIFRSTETTTIIPKTLEISQCTKSDINTLVRFENMQFNYDEIGKTYAGEQFDQFNGERELKQCNNLLPITLSTSTYSDFKSNLISNKKGNLEAVFTKDFYGEKYVLVLNTPNYLDFQEDARCDPSFYICDESVVEGSKIVFYEDFENVKSTAALEELGWTNTNINFGNEKFARRTVDGNVGVRISAYGTEESPLEAWFITPPINLDNSTNEIFTFKNKATYDNGTVLTTWISTDFDGNITEATWEQLDVAISVGPSSGFANDFISSGKIGLNCLQGTVHIAIKYVGGDPGITTTYDLDHFLVTGK